MRRLVCNSRCVTSQTGNSSDGRSGSTFSSSWRSFSEAWAACRLCVVEIGSGPASRLVTSCTYPAEDGLEVRNLNAVHYTHLRSIENMREAYRAVQRGVFDLDVILAHSDRYTLDELPQVFNVLYGEMSFVGPRPWVTYEMEAAAPWHHRRLEAVPGLTGLVQVNGRSSLGSCRRSGCTSACRQPLGGTDQRDT